jgi:phosphatidylinositol alpha 1,6-mannosyltransferase
MARGKAVVAGATGGLLGLVKHEQTGLLVQPGNPPELRAAIDRLLADPALRASLGAAAREWITELCSWDRVLESTLETYATATGRDHVRVEEPAVAAA